MTATTLRAVVVGIHCEPHVVRTLESINQAAARAGLVTESVVLLRKADPFAEAIRGMGAVVIELDPEQTMTPGGNRNLGSIGAETPLLFFVDGDIEIDPAFLGHAVAFLTRQEGIAGFGGHLDERQWSRGRVVDEERDLYRVGVGGPVEVLGAAWLCRREAFELVGGFDPALPSEEDYELCLRLRREGWKLHAGDLRVGWHDCGPRPSFSEMVRRWRSGLYAGQGLAIRRAWGTPRFFELLGRQWYSFFALGFMALGLVSIGAALAGEFQALLIWAALGSLAVLLMSLRKKSLRKGILHLLVWGVQGVALVRSVVFGPWGKPLSHSIYSESGSSR